MSGGRFDYRNDTACDEVFGWQVHVDYGMGDKEYKENVKEARKSNPLQDIELSELVFDVFCLLHSLDWYLSGDTGEDTYREDVKYFKTKWLKGGREETLKAIITERIEDVRDELLRML